MTDAPDLLTGGRAANTLTNLGLSPQQRAARADKVTASFAPYLMAGDEAKILREWQRLVESPEYEAEDLSQSWPVQFGSYVEPFALDWWERKTGLPLTRRGESVTHPDLPHVSCTLDAYRAEDACVIDCKAPGKWRKLEDVLAFYPAQLVVQRACLRADKAALLIVHGGGEPEEHTVTWDAAYEVAVWERISWFWECCETLTPPVAVTPVVAPVAAVRIADMSSSNAWGEWADKWLASKEAAKTFTKAVDELKALIPADAKKAHGHGIEASRSAKGAITIKESKS